MRPSALSGWKMDQERDEINSTKRKLFVSDWETFALCSFRHPREGGGPEITGRCAQ
jgi:hypothetical protein